MTHLSKKMKSRLLRARNCGLLKEKEGLHLITSDLRREAQNIYLNLYTLVDPQDGVIADAKFQVIGPSFLIAALDIVSELILQKNYEQIRKFDLDFILKHLVDKKDEEIERHKEFHLLLLLLDDIATQCAHLNLPKIKVTPLQAQNEAAGIVVEWDTLSHKERFELIERVIAEEVRPYIEMDEGGIDLIELIDKEVVIAYKGACTSCFSSIGATLASIQNILQTKVMKDLTVRPNMENFTF